MHQRATPLRTGIMRPLSSIAWILAVPLGAQTASAEPAAQAASPSGTVGVCVRWGVDPHHIAEAVVVVPSADPAFDDAVPAKVKALIWDRPDPPYHGEWIGIAISATGNARDLPLPKCDAAKLPPITTD